MLTVTQAASAMNVTTETVRRWLREGRLTVNRFGPVYMVDEKELEAMRERRGPGRPKGKRHE